VNTSDLVIFFALALIGGAILYIMPQALAQDEANDRAYIETVKADLRDATEYDYEQSEQAQNARHANEFLREAYKEK
jgi:hypothetical protein